LLELEFCPNTICIRRTERKGSDRIDLTPVYDLAFIEKIVINIDEPVIIRFLGFHVKDKTYCGSLKVQNVNKRFCFELKSRYVHFQIIKEGYPTEKALFLLAFFPRIKSDQELYQVVKELCDITEWLGIRQQINCIIFRYGAPRHQKDNRYQWQRNLEKTIKETKKLYTIGRFIGRIKHIQENNNRCLTISSANLFDSINVS
jgi:hypothetical protein